MNWVCSYGTAKSGVGISAMSVLRPDLMMKCVVPVIMAGIIAVRLRFLARCSTDTTTDLWSCCFGAHFRGS